MNKEKIYLLTVSFLTIFLVISTIAVLCLTAYNYDVSSYGKFSDRDLYRAYNLANEFQVAGSEMSASAGARVPGGALYYYNYLLMQVSESTEFIYSSTKALHIISILLMFFVTFRLAGYFGAAVVVAAYITASSTAPMLHHLWNPTQGIPFAAAGFCMFVLYVLRQKSLFIILSMAFGAIAAQMHLSYLSIIIAEFFGYYISGFNISRKHLKYALITLVLFYSPYLLHAAFGSFQIPELPKSNVSLGDFLHGFYIILKGLGLSEPSSLTLRLPFFPLIAGLAVALVYSRKYEGSDAITKEQYDVTLFLIYVLLACVALTSFGIASTLERYYAFYSIPAAILTGIAANTLANVLAARSQYLIRMGLIVLLSGTLLLRLGAEAYVEVTGKYAGSFNVEKLRPPLSVLNRDFGLNNGQMLSKILLLRGDSTGMASHLIYAEYLLAPFRGEESASEAADTCFAIFLHDDANIVEENIKGNFSKVSLNDTIGLATAKILGVDTHEGFAIIKYKFGDGSCPKSFQNRYIFSDGDEKELDAAHFTTTDDRDIKITEDGFRIFFSLDAPEADFPFKASLRLSAHDDIVYATLVSSQLTGAGNLLGYWQSFYVLNSSLTFVNTETDDAFSAPIFKGKLGGDYFHTPWTSSPFELPKGEYQVWFNANFVQSWGMPASPPVHRMIVENFRKD